MKGCRSLAALLVLMPFGWSRPSSAQEQTPDVMWAPGSGSQDAGAKPRGDREGRVRPVFGKISALQGDSIEVTGPDGNKITLKLTSATEYRKDHQPAKLADFKVGDSVVVRTDQADGKDTTALLVATSQFATRGSGGGSGQRGGFGGGMAMLGTLGKDYVVGEIKAIDPPRLTVLRSDNVSQTLELNEETSLHKGRDSITMADIQAGDHVLARGALLNNIFIPKNVNVFSPEQWKRVQEMMNGAVAAPGNPNAPSALSTPAAPPNPQAPPEPRN
jgi:Domain of unknown function (DUF5666)